MAKDSAGMLALLLDWQSGQGRKAVYVIDVSIGIKFADISRHQRQRQSVVPERNGSIDEVFLRSLDLVLTKQVRAARRRQIFQLPLQIRLPEIAIEVRNSYP